jgi:hypothetical protein
MSSLAAARADNFYYPPGFDPDKHGSLNKVRTQSSTCRNTMVQSRRMASSTSLHVKQCAAVGCHSMLLWAQHL